MEKLLEEFLSNKPAPAVELFKYFVAQYKLVGKITVHPAKTMIGIASSRKRIAYVTRLGKDFIHVVFPFQIPYSNNLCFEKIAQVPGDARQFNHHFRMRSREDINDEVLSFMKLAYEEGS